jgi:hypothetical protein
MLLQTKLGEAVGRNRKLRLLEGAMVRAFVGRSTLK